MKYLTLQKTFSDGRVFNYHKIYSIQLISSSNIEVSLGSWYTLAELMTSSLPDIVTKIQIVRPENLTNEEFISQLLEQILLLPEWQNAELIDLSQPPPLPVIEE